MEGRKWRLNLHYVAEENGAAKQIALDILDRIVLNKILLTEGDNQPSGTGTVECLSGYSDTK